jgi:hypothetical protein
MRSARRIAPWLLLAVLPLVVAGAMLIGSFHVGTGAWALDFTGNLTTPAHDILRGSSPYHSAYVEHVHDAVAAGHHPDEFSHGVFATYPAPTLLIGIPFAYLPAGLAAWLWVGLMLGCAALALRIVGAGDWRVYGAALLAPALSSSLVYGTIQCGLMLGLAATWRWRRHALRGGLALGVLIALKLLFVPLLAWLAITRRWAAAGVACTFAGCLWLAGWALIDFHGFADYPHLLTLVTDIEKSQGYSSIAYARSLGLPDAAASAAPYVLGCAALTLLWIAMRRRGPQAEAHGFLLATVAVLAFSPIVWQHYLGLLFVPLAVIRPRFSAIWLIPSLLWLTPYAAYSAGDATSRVVFAAVAFGTVVAALGPSWPHHGPSARLVEVARQPSRPNSRAA